MELGVQKLIRASRPFIKETLGCAEYNLGFFALANDHAGVVKVLVDKSVMETKYAAFFPMTYSLQGGA